MKNLEALVKKIETFEKLAVYGDRRTFLKSLAQDAAQEQFDRVGPNSEPSQEISIIRQISAVLQDANVTDSSVLQPINNAMMFNKIDVGAIVDAAMRASKKMTGVADAAVSSKLFNLAQQLMRVSYRGELSKVPHTPGGEDEVVQPVSVTTIPQAKKIDKEEQRALGKILTIEGIGLPLDPDGILGPKTKAAIEAFKKKFKFNPFTKTYVLTDEDALTYAKMLSETDKYK